MSTRNATTTATALSFRDRLVVDRAAGRPLLDLSESDPTRCGLASNSGAPGPAPSPGEASVGGASDEVLCAARDAVASYLAGRGAAIGPDRVVLAPAWAVALGWALDTCGGSDEILVPRPGGEDLVIASAAAGLTVRRFAIDYADGCWRLDRKRLVGAAADRTRAVLLGNPSEPSGMALDTGDLALLGRVAAERGLVVIADERLLETATPPCASVLQADGCVSIHLSELGAVCGATPSDVAWCGVGGPDHLASGVLAALRAREASSRSGLPSALAAVPALLARRGVFEARLRARVDANRARLAAASLREAPWSVLRGRGGRWCVLEVGSALSDEELGLALLDVGVVVPPASTFGLPARGYLALSLLPEPARFDEALQRVEALLRAPLHA